MLLAKKRPESEEIDNDANLVWIIMDGNSTRFFTILDKLEMLVLSTAGGTQHRSHINNTFLLVIYVFSML